MRQPNHCKEHGIDDCSECSSRKSAAQFHVNRVAPSKPQSESVICPRCKTEQTGAHACKAKSESGARELPRRMYLDRLVPAELAIVEAMSKVENMGADIKLTEAIVLLGQANDKVADFVDAQLRGTHE